MNFSKHALERFVERSMNYTNSNEVKQYLCQNEDIVKERIQKLFDSSTFIHSAALREHSKTDIYINAHGWVLLVDQGKNNLITVYKVDLHLDEDFNREYTTKMMAKIQSAKDQFKVTCNQLQEESNEIELEIKKIDKEIALYTEKIGIRQQEKQNYQHRKNILSSKVQQEEDTLKLHIENFISKKIF